MSPVTTSAFTTTDSRIREEPSSTSLKSPGKFSNIACSKWVHRLTQVKAFTARHGHCRIPQVYLDDPDLGKWAKRQRFQYKRYMKEVAGKSSMTKERIAVLEDFGFCWDIQKELWEEMYIQLVRYVRIHGDTKVPKNTKEHFHLGIWVNRQRRTFQTMGVGGEKNQLSMERFQQLDAIGFDWYTLLPRCKGGRKGSTSK